jgi:hypothetical protein
MGSYGHILDLKCLHGFPARRAGRHVPRRHAHRRRRLLASRPPSRRSRSAPHVFPRSADPCFVWRGGFFRPGQESEALITAEISHSHITAPLGPTLWPRPMVVGQPQTVGNGKSNGDKNVRQRSVPWFDRDAAQGGRKPKVAGPGQCSLGGRNKIRLSGLPSCRLTTRAGRVLPGRARGPVGRPGTVDLGGGGSFRTRRLTGSAS